MTAYADPPSLADIEAMARRTLAELPAPFAERIEGLGIRIEDFPDEETCLEMELESPFELLGLYRGVSLDRKSLWDVPEEPDMVFLYRRPILDYWCESGEDLEHIVRHVLIHEIGHHFGFSDEDMEQIEEGG